MLPLEARLVPVRPGKFPAGGILPLAGNAVVMIKEISVTGNKVIALTKRALGEQQDNCTLWRIFCGLYISNSGELTSIRVKCKF